ncbi:hypothetical protein O4J56_24810 [Nocardiopsis sp. RSe5-2]|uniref:MABP domain-containing protein n=1 Tax=Nocardiopsis endophytica TaxID=3018445 RepID=A0ABT4UBR4_9ACTN|nr:hypothetical protein [Nocardiopsis endophytica]MDA2813889.1 hypothetical protein [Nocardiopsis endophytica]
MAVTSLTVLQGDQPAPEGWIKITKDLNAGAGGAYLYFAYEHNGQYVPITNIYFLLSRDQEPPPNYIKIPVDLNKGAGGEYIYACYTHDPSEGQPIQALDVLISGDANPMVPKPWERYDTDLNKGAGGKYVYLIHLSV